MSVPLTLPTVLSGSITPCVAWKADCQGKWDYDGRVISVSCRYWPARSNEGPSAKAEIVLNHGTPDQDGFGEQLVLAQKEFKGDTEQSVKAQVEAWVADRFTRLIYTMRGDLMRECTV